MSLEDRENPLGVPGFQDDDRDSVTAVVNGKFNNLRDSVERQKEKAVIKMTTKTPRFGANKLRNSRLEQQDTRIEEASKEKSQELSQSPADKRGDESTVKKEGQQPVLEAGSRMKLHESLASGKGRNHERVQSDAGRSYNVSISSEEDTERLADAVKGLGKVRSDAAAGK